MSAVPAVTAQDLELEHAELLPARETLAVLQLEPYCRPHYYPRPYPPCCPGGPIYHYYPGPVRV